MNRYSEDLSLAYKFVNSAAQEYDEGNPFLYVYLLYGVAHISVGEVGKEHNYRAVIDAMHLYKKNNPTKPVEEAFKVALSKAIIMVAGPKAVNSLFNIYEYELIKEKDGTNSFTLDFIPVLKDMEKLGRRKSKRVLGDDYKLRLEKLKYSVAIVQSNIYDSNNYVNPKKKK